MKRTRSISLILTLIMLVSMAMPVFAADEGVEFTLIHTNDTHSRIEEGKYAGMGFDKIATLVKEKRTAGNVLLLDAGDTFHGQTFATISKGESVAKVLNLLKYDALTAGNHDFNYGQERLLELDGMTDFPILGANVMKDGKAFLQEYTIKEIDGIKVGIFGLTSPETSYKTHPKNVVGIKFESPIEVAKKMVAELEDKTDMIICLGHIGLDESTEITSKDVVEAVDGIDIFVDGHSHTTLAEGLVVNNTTIVQTGEYDKNLGVVTVTVKDGAVTVMPSLVTKEAAAEIAPDSEVEALISSIAESNSVITSVIVAQSDQSYEGERAFVRTQQTNLGTLIADAMIYSTGAEIAITNGGGIRASIEPGDISQGDIITVLPFGNYVVTKNVSGAEIKTVIEMGIGSYPETKGAYPHVAGMTFKFDEKMAEGSRITEIMYDGKALKDDQMYVVALNDYIAAGGDGYDVLEDNPIIGEYPALDEVVVAYLGRPKTEMYTVVSGDMLWKIARDFKTTAKEIAAYNKMKNPDLIFPGDMLMIPSK